MTILKSKLSKIVLGFVVAVLVLGFVVVAPSKAQALDASQCAAAKAALVALGIPAATADAILASQCSSSPSTSYTFTKDLKQGVTDPEVMSLQQFLNGAGFTVSASGTGSAGSESSYFGAKTKAALMAFQASQGVSPVLGYFGPLTRAAVQAWIASHASTTDLCPNDPGIQTVLPCSGPVTTTGPVSVSLAAGSPAGSAIAGAGQIDSLKFNVTASSAGGDTLTGLTFTKAGVVSDSAISNLYLADESGVIVAQFSSLSGGVATFSGVNIQVNAGQTRTLMLRTDLSTGSNAGNTLAWNLTAATLSSAATVGGLPVNGNTLTVTTVTNPSIATATLTFLAVGSSVDAGTTGVQVAAITANVNNSAAWLKSVKFSAVGSANWADIKNLKLMVNGTQVGTTLAQVASDGAAVFSLATPAQLNTGNSTIEVFADIMGSPNRNVTFTILRPYDVNVVDSQYNTGISPSVVTTAATQIAIQQGQITVTTATDTPTGAVPVGASSVTLGKFNIYASGEAVKVKFLDVKFTANSSSTITWAGATTDLRNIKIIDNAGNQVGSTISTISSGTTTGLCSGSNTGLVGAHLTCNLGDSSSVINYTVPANTTRVLSVVADIPSTSTGFTSLLASLPAQTSNLEGQTSFQTSSSGSSNGATLTVTTTPLSISVNSAVATQTYALGASGKRLASFSITASSAEGARVSSLTLDKDIGTDAFDTQNVKVMVGSTQFGATRTTVADGGITMAFSGSSSITVPAGGSVTVDVYGDVLSSSTAATYGATIDVTGWSALGSVSNSSITFPGAVNGQATTVSSGGAVTISTDSATPASKQVVMGSTGNELFKLKFQETSNVEDVKITDLIFRDTIGSGAAGRASFQNVTLWDGSTQVGGPNNMVIGTASATSTVTFSFSTPIVVTRNNSKVLTLKGDVADINSLGSVSGSLHVFGIATTTTDVIALGKDSNASATVTGAPVSNTSTVAQTKLALSSSLLGASSGRTRVAVDDVATLNFAANSAYQLTVNSITLKFSGGALASATFNVSLIDANTNANWGSSATQVCTTASSTCSVTVGPQYVVSAGDTKAVKVRVDSSSFSNGASTSDSMSVVVNANTDVIWNDGVGAFNLESTVTPFTVVNVSYE